jgi:hypothetical protein
MVTILEGLPNYDTENLLPLHHFRPMYPSLQSDYPPLLPFLPLKPALSSLVAHLDIVVFYPDESLQLLQPTRRKSLQYPNLDLTTHRGSPIPKVVGTMEVTGVCGIVKGEHRIYGNRYVSAYIPKECRKKTCSYSNDGSLV